jgi:predicted metal-dependent peptidase
MSALTKLAMARMFASIRVPYFNAALMALVPKEVPDGTLMGEGQTTIAVTSRAVLLWERGAIERWSVDELAAVLIHEVQHVLRRTHARCAENSFDPKLFNLADDAAINDDLVEMRLALPDGGGFQPKDIPAETGLTGEEYYAKLLDRAQRQGQSSHEEQDGESGRRLGSGRCGGCSGTPSDAEKRLEDEAPEDGRSEQELDLIRAQVAREIEERQKSRGDVPTGLRRWAELQRQPQKVDWRKKLAVLCRSAIAYRQGAVARTFRRPSRRQAGIGFGEGKPIVAGRVRPIPSVAFALDTSGSMSERELSYALREAAGVLQTLSAEATFIACDAKVHSVARVRSAGDLLKHVRGGGGTDFEPIFRETLAMKPRPEVLIIATDGHGPAPSLPPPGVKVIWLLVGKYSRKPACARTGKDIEWGSFVEVAE